MTRRAARVFRAEALADGLTNDDNDNGDGNDAGKDGKGHRRGDRVAADFLQFFAVGHRKSFLVRRSFAFTIARFAEKSRNFSKNFSFAA